MDLYTVIIVGLAISAIQDQETNVSIGSVRAARDRDQVDDGGLNDLHRLINLPYAPQVNQCQWRPQRQF